MNDIRERLNELILKSELLKKVRDEEIVEMYFMNFKIKMCPVKNI
tara:strand:+ start:68 stop:202 length:135 start_codon:yes stop_codon:yes gene_type:complete